MESYKEEIFDLAKGKKEQLFYNSSEQHAQIVHQAIAQTAEKYICILSASLCSEISNNDTYCNSIRAFLSKDPSRMIKIVLTDYDEQFQGKQLATVLRLYASQVDVRQFSGSVRKEGHPIHFTFADDRMFRLETDIVNHMAYGSFNLPDQVKGLKTVFDQVFEMSAPVQLTNA